jgi:hypothetical protein
MVHGGVTHEVGKHAFAVSDPSPPTDPREGSAEVGRVEGCADLGGVHWSRGQGTGKLTPTARVRRFYHRLESRQPSER